MRNRGIGALAKKRSFCDETVRLRNAVKDYCFLVHGIRVRLNDITPQWIASIIDWDEFAILWGVGPLTIAELAFWLERNGQEVTFPERRLFSEKVKDELDMLRIKRRISERGKGEPLEAT